MRGFAASPDLLLLQSRRRVLVGAHAENGLAHSSCVFVAHHAELRLPTRGRPPPLHVDASSLNPLLLQPPTPSSAFTACG
jgi:hypothetical protein